jgi:hypothetical protein
MLGSLPAAYSMLGSLPATYSLPLGKKTTPHNKKSVLWVRTHTVTYVTSCYLPLEFAIVFATVMECPLLSTRVLLHLWYSRHI